MPRPYFDGFGARHFIEEEENLSRNFADACKIFFAMDIESDGLAHYVIFGKHINGGFIALPRNGISAEQSLNNNRGYNVEKLIQAGMSEKTAEDIVAFCEDWIKKNKPDLSSSMSNLGFRDTSRKIDLELGY